jgi:iron complex outermembrane receptor protein
MTPKKGSLVDVGSHRSHAVVVTLISLTLAFSAGVACAASAAAPAADTATNTLEEVVVTGSLIPQTVKETAQPLTVITPDDIQKKGFSSVADALQHASFATGSVQGANTTGAFTQGAQTLSLFGLSPSYTKYLIDGRPIADYPALYNGTDIITSISGIPTVLIDHIDILPGGQSSIYGSDAIAGVININLKKKMDGPEADVRYGWTKDGGGTQKRIGLADGFNSDKFTAVVGGQYERIDPIWGYQRDMTQQYFAGNSNSPQTAERDWLVLSQNQNNGSTGYEMLDPTKCAGVASQFGGTVGLQSRPGRDPAGPNPVTGIQGPGYFCGTDRAGYYTLNNGQENTQGYLHATYVAIPSIQLFSDVLISHEVVRFNTGSSFYSSADSSVSPLYYFEDAAVPGQYLNVQRLFSPEEVGNLGGQDDKDTTNSIRATLGAQGAIDASAWKYTLDFTYTENKLTEDTHLAFTNEIEAFFSQFSGPQIGIGPGTQPLYAFNFAKFYTPITPAEYASFTGYATSYSRTEDSLARAEVTNSSLFTLPGGDAGLALLVEGGHQSWQYDPDPRFLDGETYLFTAVAGDGDRNRYAGTTEIRLPVLPQVTVDASGRYDDYQLTDTSVDKLTYNLGLEYRPLKTLLIRGRYGTAFKAPTLSDEFQGQSGFFTSAQTDYYYCDTHGFKNNYAACPQGGESFQGTIEGNPNLKPITATVWDGGVVWAPLEHSSLSVDYLSWRISNEVQQQPVDQLLRTEAACLEGELNPTTPTCVTAISQVTRDPTSGLITLINTPKENLSQENLEVLLFQGSYRFDAGHAGNFLLDAAYTHVIKHNFINFPGDPQVNYLTSPFYSTEFRDKANASLTWNYGKFSTTLYTEYYGTSPNNQATLDVSGYAQPGAAKLHPWIITNYSASYEVLNGLVVSFNIDNAFNRQPPYDSTYTGIDNQPYNTQNYNDYGRSYFIEGNYKFGR